MPLKARKSILAREILPKWTARVATDVGGRDPLGLSRVAANVTDNLLRGIITTTDRARYYSFYSWVVWHINREDAPKAFQDFANGLRRREAMMALATVFEDSATSPVGVNAVRPKLDLARQTKEVDCDFRVLPSNPMGGYSQYYAGSMYNLGLTYSEQGIDLVTKEVGEALASAYQKVVEKTPYIRKKQYKKRYFPFDDLSASAASFSLDTISKDCCKEERKKLIDIFFGFNQKEPSGDSLFRRFTLCQIMQAIDTYKKKGLPVNLERSRPDFPLKSKRDRLAWYLVYPVYYYGVLWPQTNKTLTYNPHEKFKDCFFLWRQFCLQQLLTQALEMLLNSLLCIIGADPDGMKLERVISSMAGKEYTVALKDMTGKNCSSPSGLMAALGLSDIPDAAACATMRKSITLFHPLSEVSVLSHSRKTPSQISAAAIVILSVLYAKWRNATDDPAFVSVRGLADVEFWAGNVLPFMDKWFDPTLSWDRALTHVIESYVMHQHDRIMYEKRNYESRWFEIIEGNIMHLQDYEPEWRSSRHENATSILVDLRLLHVDRQGDWALTSEGSAILAKIQR